MVKFRKASEHAAYEIAEGVTSADQAADLGLAVVESDGYGNPTAYGRYKNAPDGGPLGITVDKAAETEVVAGGGVSAGDAATTGGKGNLVNPDDPVIHGGGDEIHADGAEPPVNDLAAREAEEAKVAEASIEKASKTKRGK